MEWGQLPFPVAVKDGAQAELNSGRPPLEMLDC
jgi:hypothetical protein